MRVVFNPLSGKFDFVGETSGAAVTYPLSPANGGTGINNGTNALTIPATGTAALLATANVFTTQQMVDGASDQIQFRVQGHSTQTSRLVTFEDSAGTVLAYISKEGRLAIGNPSAAANHIHINTDSPSIRLQNTGGGGGNFFFGVDSANGYWQVGDADTGLSPMFIYKGQMHALLALRSGVGIGGINPAQAMLHVQKDTTTTNAVQEVARLQSIVSTASTGGANGFGMGLSLYAETATNGTIQQQGLVSTSWIDATNASRKAKMSLSAYDTAARLGIEIEADGSVAKLGFYGVTTIVRPTTAIAEAAFTENAGGTAVNVDSTFGGYTLQQIAQALQNIGILT